MRATGGGSASYELAKVRRACMTCSRGCMASATSIGGLRTPTRMARAKPRLRGPQLRGPQLREAHPTRVGDLVGRSRDEFPRNVDAAPPTLGGRLCRTEAATSFVENRLAMRSIAQPARALPRNFTEPIVPALRETAPATNARFAPTRGSPTSGAPPTLQPHAAQPVHGIPCA